MDNRYIGVFDSGVGGLTSVPYIMRMLPDERIIFFGDTARTPYGSKAAGTIHITEYAMRMMGRDGQIGQPREQFPLLLAPDRGLARGQALEGRVQMQVGRVQDLQLSHNSLTLSALWQRPVSESITNRQPSSLLAPLAAS